MIARMFGLSDFGDLAMCLLLSVVATSASGRSARDTPTSAPQTPNTVAELFPHRNPGELASVSWQEKRNGYETLVPCGVDCGRANVAATNAPSRALPSRRPAAAAHGERVPSRLALWCAETEQGMAVPSTSEPVQRPARNWRDPGGAGDRRPRPVRPRPGRSADDGVRLPSS